MARILLIDDNTLDLTIMENMLVEYKTEHYKSDWELRITKVDSAIKALDIIYEHNFELIITDIVMARMDGWELIKEIRKKFPQFGVPIIVISAVAGVDLEYEGMRSGASAWFSKPLKPKEFAAEVFKLIQAR